MWLGLRRRGFVEHEEDVLTFEVTVNDPNSVGGFQPRTEVPHHPPFFQSRQAADVPQLVGQGHAFQQLHGEKQELGMTAHVEEAAHVGVGDSARQEHLAFQAPIGSIIGSQVLRQNFQRDPLVQKLILDFVDLPHSTAAQQTSHMIPIGEARSGSQARRRRAANLGPWCHRRDGRRGFAGNRARRPLHQQRNRSSTRLALIDVGVEAVHPGGTELSAAEGEEGGFGRTGRKHAARSSRPL